jgi:hypothetical protein
MLKILKYDILRVPLLQILTKKVKPSIFIKKISP